VRPTVRRSTPKAGDASSPATGSPQALIMCGHPTCPPTTGCCGCPTTRLRRAPTGWVGHCMPLAALI
jgi:hypothetical protein